MLSLIIVILQFRVSRVRSAETAVLARAPTAQAWKAMHAEHLFRSVEPQIDVVAPPNVPQSRHSYSREMVSEREPSAERRAGL